MHPLYCRYNMKMSAMGLKHFPKTVFLWIGGTNSIEIAFKSICCSGHEASTETKTEIHQVQNGYCWVQQRGTKCWKYQSALCTPTLYSGITILCLHAFTSVLSSDIKMFFFPTSFSHFLLNFEVCLNICWSYSTANKIMTETLALCINFIDKHYAVSITFLWPFQC